MSYLHLLEILEATAPKASDTRTRVLMQEYGAALAQITPRRTAMAKPQMSQSTRAYVAAQASLNRMAVAAHQDSENFIWWVVQLLKERLRPLLGDDLVCDETFGCAWVLRRKSWQHRGLGYGLGYSVESRPGRKLLPEYPHLLGVRVQPVNGAQVTATQADLTTDLVAWLRQHWSSEISLGDDGVLAGRSGLLDNNEWWAWYTPMPPRADEVWERWSERVVDGGVRTATALVHLLDEFKPTV